MTCELTEMMMAAMSVRCREVAVKLLVLQQDEETGYEEMRAFGAPAECGYDISMARARSAERLLLEADVARDELTAWLTALSDRDAELLLAEVDGDGDDVGNRFGYDDDDEMPEWVPMPPSVAVWMSVEAVFEMPQSRGW